MKTIMALAAILFAAGVTQATAQEPVKIGYAISKTGQFAPAAHTQIQTYELWQDQVAAAGGIDVGGTKRPVKFITYDDQSDFSKAPQIYEKLITDDKVDLLLAPWGTPFHFAIAGILEKYQFPVVGNSAASVTIRNIKPGNIWFPTSCIPDRLGAELAKFLVQQKVKTAAVTTLQLPFSLEVKKYLMPALESAGIKVVVNDEYAPDVKDLTATLTKIKQAAPDAVLSLSYPSELDPLYEGRARARHQGAIPARVGRPNRALLLENVRIESRRRRHHGALVAARDEVAEGQAVLRRLCEEV